VAEILNLGRARKAKARAKIQSQAAQNRVTFGRTKARKAVESAAKARSDAALDGHKREP
jgi:Domain of unknown function (DUF4169)